MTNAALEILNDRLQDSRERFSNNETEIDELHTRIHDLRIMNSNIKLEIGQLESAIAAVRRNINVQSPHL